MHPLAFLEVYMIRVMVNGAGGKMGREVVKAVHNDPELTLVGGIDPTKAGQDVGSVAGIEQLGITMNASIDEVLDTNKPDVIVDFTNPAVIYENAKKMLSAGIHVVIGTTGLTAEQRDELLTFHHSHQIVLLGELRNQVNERCGLLRHQP